MPRMNERNTFHAMREEGTREDSSLSFYADGYRVTVEFMRISAVLITHLLNNMIKLRVETSSVDTNKSTA